MRRVRVRQTGRDTAWVAVQSEPRDGSYNLVEDPNGLTDGPDVALIPATFKWHCWQVENKKTVFSRIIKQNQVQNLV